MEWVTLKREMKKPAFNENHKCLDNCFVYFATHWFVELCLSLLYYLTAERNEVVKGGTWMLIFSNFNRLQKTFFNLRRRKSIFLVIQSFSLCALRQGVSRLRSLFKYHFRWHTKAFNSSAPRDSRRRASTRRRASWMNGAKVKFILIHPRAVSKHNFFISSCWDNK